MSNPDFSQLGHKFSQSELEWRVLVAKESDGGEIRAMVVPYITNRAIMNRLDEVVGPANWKNEYCAGPDGGVLCGLALRLEGEWVVKWDGSENTMEAPIKGGLSTSMKRAAVHWGIGRYLYEIDTILWAVVSSNGKFRGKTKNTEKSFKWDPPALPESMLPGGEKPVKPSPAPRRKHKQENEERQRIMQLLDEHPQLFEDRQQEIRDDLDAPKIDVQELRDWVDWMEGEIERAINDAQQAQEYGPDGEMGLF